MNFANVTDWTIPEGDVIRVTDSQNRIIWEKKTGPDYTEPFYVENITNNNETLRIVKKSDDESSYPAAEAPTLTIQYSTDKTRWYSLGTTSTTAIRHTITPGSKLYLRCSTNNWSKVYVHNIISGVSKVGGNIMSLLYGNNFVGTEASFPNTTANTLSNIFQENTNLLNADSLLLPSTVLNNGCYAYMFYKCSSLLSAIINLPALVGTQDCYYSMFGFCSAMTTIPTLKLTSLGTRSCAHMFNGCSSITVAPILHSASLGEACYSGMFSGCTSLITAPVLISNQTKYYCYHEMFKGCTSLTTAPDLNATSLAGYCYYNMFYGCSNLNKVKCLATSKNTGSTSSWLAGVSANGTFTKSASSTIWSTGTSGIPSGWTVVEQ